MRLSDPHHAAVEGISTGCLSLDLAIGANGFPRGRIIELFGPESSGKTTLALHVIASAQKGGGSQPLSMRNMLSTRAGPSGWGSTWKSCWSASPATGKRLCRLQKC